MHEGVLASSIVVLSGCLLWGAGVLSGALTSGNGDSAFLASAGGLLVILFGLHHFRTSAGLKKD